VTKHFKLHKRDLEIPKPFYEKVNAQGAINDMMNASPPAALAGRDPTQQKR
jgi:hypothetical protein